MIRLLFLMAAASILSFTASSSAASRPVGKTAVAKPAVARPAVAKPVEKTADQEQLKEFDLARKLVDTLGFGEGLPEKPLEKDYLQILGGSRTFKFEAENTFDQQSDPVSVRDYPLFGAFSGAGWVHGTTNQVAVHFKVFLPFSGKYTLKAAAKGDNQLWSVAGKAFRLSSGDKFNESTLGQLFIPAGELEFNAVIPPSGAIDYFTLTAPAYAPVEPLAGWTPAGPLTAAKVNETIASLLGLEPLLPDDAGYKAKVIEAASLPGLPGRVHITDNKVLGKTVAAKWVRAFQKGATLTVPIEIETSSVYRVRVRAVGTEISAGFGQRKIIAALKPDFNWIDLGTFRLPKGLNSLELQLPPTGGIDIIEVTKKLSSPADYAAIAKSGINMNAEIKPAELDALIKAIQTQFKERR